MWVLFQLHDIYGSTDFGNLWCQFFCTFGKPCRNILLTNLFPFSCHSVFFPFPWKYPYILGSFESGKKTLCPGPQVPRYLGDATKTRRNVCESRNSHSRIHSESAGTTHEQRWWRVMCRLMGNTCCNGCSSPVRWTSGFLDAPSTSENLLTL